MEALTGAALLGAGCGALSSLLFWIGISYGLRRAERRSVPAARQEASGERPRQKKDQEEQRAGDELRRRLVIEAANIENFGTDRPQQEVI